MGEKSIVMSPEALLEFIKNISKDTTREISLETLLFKEKILDSMNILDLLGYVEKTLGRRLTDAEIVMQNFESPSTIVNTFFTNV